MFYFTHQKTTKLVEIGFNIFNRRTCIYFIGKRGKFQWKSLIPSIQIDYDGIHVGFYFGFVLGFQILMLDEI